MIPNDKSIETSVEKKTLSCLYIGLAVLFAIMLGVGTIWDRPVASALYFEDFSAPKALNLGVIVVFLGSCMVFLGALGRQLMNHVEKKIVRIALAAAFSYLFVSTAILGGAAVLNDPLVGHMRESASIGFLSGSAEVTFLRSFLAGTVVFAPWYLLGAIGNGRRYDKKTVRALLGLIVIMTMEFIMATYLNCTIVRPHYRLTVGGAAVADGGVTIANGVGSAAGAVASTAGAAEFVPWYRLSGTGKFLMSLQDLIAAHPGSFVCGHAMYAVMFLVIFPTYALVFPRLAGKKRALTIAALVLILPIIFARMLTGDNYLTDIALGGISAVKICFSYNASSGSGGRIRKLIAKCRGGNGAPPSDSGLSEEQKRQEID